MVSAALWSHLPIMQVLLPLATAPLSALLGRGRGPWFITLLASFAAFVISILLYISVIENGPIHYDMGGWAPPWGIEYRIDAMNALILLLISGVSLPIVLWARRSVEQEIAARQRPLFYTCFLLCLAGLLGVVITGDAFNIFVFLEISSLSTYILIATGEKNNRRALTATYNYLILGTVGTTFFVIGIGFLYAVTGTLNLTDLALLIPETTQTRTISVAFAFIVIGLGLKVAIFPLHGWLPNAYAYAPSAVSAFLAATATKAALYVLLRFILNVFGIDFSFITIPLDVMLGSLAIVAMVIMSAVAFFQTNIKRMLAYSSIAQIGYILLGIALATPAGLTAAILHLFNHALMKGTLFLATGCLVYRLGVVTLESISGAGRSMPWTMAAFIVGGLSLIGVPLTAGFISKWYLIEATLNSGAWPLVFAIGLSSLIALGYVGRIVEAAWFGQAPDNAPPVKEAPFSLLMPTFILALANIWFGLDGTFPVEAARQATVALMTDLSPAIESLQP
ncbi:MAG: monovalent cation/H+ antiporter subunit D family protein [Parvularculales bacterium]